MTWNNIVPECMLCEMDRRTHWYYEDDDLVIADTLAGNPFVVWKEHKKSVTEGEREAIESAVSELFDDYELIVIMNMVPDHFHAHVVTDEEVDLSGE